MTAESTGDHLETGSIVTALRMRVSKAEPSASTGAAQLKRETSTVADKFVKQITYVMERDQARLLGTIYTISEIIIFSKVIEN